MASGSVRTVALSPEFHRCWFLIFVGDAKRHSKNWRCIAYHIRLSTTCRFSSGSTCHDMGRVTPRLVALTETAYNQANTALQVHAMWSCLKQVHRLETVADTLPADDAPCHTILSGVPDDPHQVLPRSSTYGVSHHLCSWLPINGTDNFPEMQGLTHHLVGNC